MASNVEAASAARVPQRGYMADQPFFTAFAVILAAFIVAGFAQFQLRGFADFRTAPLYLHIHGAVMLSWLGLYVLQSWLVSKGQVKIHRKTGWLSLAVAVGVVGMGSWTGIHAIATGRVPPFFTPAFFLALTQVGVVAFAVAVGLAVQFRRQVQWHRRLMIGSGVLIAEPALGRLLPMPLLGQTWGEMLAMVVQLGFVAVLARHDRKVLGQVHPATLVVAGLLVTAHLLIELLSRVPAWAALAGSIAAG